MALTQEPLSVDYRHVQHFQLDPSIKRLVQKRIEANRRLGHHGIRNLSQAKNIHVANLKKSIVTYYFDYNTVEIVLIGCNIFLALVSTGTVLNGGQCLDVWMFGCLCVVVWQCLTFSFFPSPSLPFLSFPPLSLPFLTTGGHHV
jgi:hypothetical protein